MNESKQPLVFPSSKREALLKKIDEFKIGNLNARDLSRYNRLTEQLSTVFKKICWNKLGIAPKPLQQLNQQDLEELAKMVYEQSKMAALIQTGIWACIPFVGWIVLSATLSDLDTDDPLNVNMRYYWWYRRIKNKFGKNFKPLVLD